MQSYAVAKTKEEAFPRVKTSYKAVLQLKPHFQVSDAVDIHCIDRNLVREREKSALK